MERTYKYQEIEELLRGNVDPRLLKVIQSQHAEIVGLKQEITGICQGLDKMISVINNLAAVGGMHQQIFVGLEQGKSMSDIIAEMCRTSHPNGK